jgi:hypothetical protein
MTQQLARRAIFRQQRSGLQNAIEKRCIICRWFGVCQLLAAWRRARSKLGCPAAFNRRAIGDRQRLATSGVSLERSQYVVR